MARGGAAASRPDPGRPERGSPAHRGPTQLDRARRLAAKNLVSAEELEQAETQLKTAPARPRGGDCRRAPDAGRSLRARGLAPRRDPRSAGRGDPRTVRGRHRRTDGVGGPVRARAGAGHAAREAHPLRLTAEIPEQFGPGISVDKPLSLRTDAFPDAPVEGRITRISPDVNLKSRAFASKPKCPIPTARSSPAPSPGSTSPPIGSTAPSSSAMSAVQTRYGTSLVFLVRNEPARPARRSSSAIGSDRTVEIMDGLEAGPTIVSEGVEGLNTGMRVAPRQPSAHEAEAAGRRAKEGRDAK